jgi:NTP pyrophosphatase (non-canonical NTP hydrolase)
METMSENIYKKIVDKWGVESQLNMVTEEIGELLQAISKFRRSYNKDEATKAQAYDHLCEEIADVENMINQMREMFDSELIDKYREAKLERISKKLDEYN